MKLRSLIHVLLALAMLITLNACDGGGGGSKPPGDDTPPGGGGSTTACVWNETSWDNCNWQ
jgi:predicted small lipoprotein YifL